MYCSSCGKGATQNLNYCSGCGKILTAASISHTAKLGGLIWSVPLAVGAITLGGFGTLLYFRLEFAGGGSGVSLTGAMMLAIFSGVLVIDWILLRQLSRFVNNFHPLTHTAKRKQSDTVVKPPTLAERKTSIHATGQPTRFLEMPAEELKKNVSRPRIF